MLLYLNKSVWGSADFSDNLTSEGFVGVASTRDKVILVLSWLNIVYAVASAVIQKYTKLLISSRFQQTYLQSLVYV